MSFWKWSKTAAANATADTSINWAEGQAPSSVNDSARAMMAAAAKFRDDTAGALATGGTSAAYAVASNQVFDSLANMNGAVIAFVPHVSNGGPCTLNVDGLTAKPVRAAPGVDLGPGVLVAGTPYAATYRNASGEWLLHGFYGNTGGSARRGSAVFPPGGARQQLCIPDRAGDLAHDLFGTVRADGHELGRR